MLQLFQEQLRQHPEEYIDDIIEPDATRKRVIAAIQMLLSKEEMRPYKKHGTIRAGVA